MHPGIPVGSGNVISLRNQRSAGSEAMHACYAMQGLLPVSPTPATYVCTSRWQLLTDVARDDHVLTELVTYSLYSLYDGGV